MYKAIYFTCKERILYLHPTDMHWFIDLSEEAESPCDTRAHGSISVNAF